LAEAALFDAAGALPVCFGTALPVQRKNKWRIKVDKRTKLLPIWRSRADVDLQRNMCALPGGYLIERTGGLLHRVFLRLHFPLLVPSFVNPSEERERAAMHKILKLSRREASCRLNNSRGDSEA